VRPHAQGAGYARSRIDCDPASLAPDCCSKAMNGLLRFADSGAHQGVITMHLGIKLNARYHRPQPSEPTSFERLCFERVARSPGVTRQALQGVTGQGNQRIGPQL